MCVRERGVFEREVCALVTPWLLCALGCYGVCERGVCVCLRERGVCERGVCVCLRERCVCVRERFVLL